MNIKIPIIILIIVLVIIGFYFVGKHYNYWNYFGAPTSKSIQPQIPPQAATVIPDTSSTSVIVPSSSQTLGGQINAAVPNPVQQIPQTNPYQVVNPYSNVKTNPFAK